MKLVTYCKSCSHPNSIDDKGVVVRGDLEDKYGSKIYFQCEKCLAYGHSHPNQVYAKVSKMPLLLCSIIGLFFIGMAFLFPISSIGMSTFWPLSIGGLILTAGFISSRSSTAHAFNKSLVR